MTKASAGGIPKRSQSAPLPAACKKLVQLVEGGVYGEGGEGGEGGGGYSFKLQWVN